MCLATLLQLSVKPSYYWSSSLDKFTKSLLIRRNLVRKEWRTEEAPAFCCCSLRHTFDAWYKRVTHNDCSLLFIIIFHESRWALSRAGVVGWEHPNFCWFQPYNFQMILWVTIRLIRSTRYFLNIFIGICRPWVCSLYIWLTEGRRRLWCFLKFKAFAHYEPNCPGVCISRQLTNLMLRWVTCRLHERATAIGSDKRVSAAPGDSCRFWPSLRLLATWEFLAFGSCLAQILGEKYTVKKASHLTILHRFWLPHF